MTQGKALQDVMFPIGGMSKKNVKLLARQHFDGLNVLMKRESVGLCFVGKRNFPDFLSKYITLSPGR